MTRHVTTQHPTVFRPVRRLSFLLLLAMVAFMSPRGQAQTQPASRIAGNIDASSQVALHGTVSPHIRAAVDQGRVSGNLKLTGLTLVFTQSAAQRADLKQLLVDQQTPGSSSYHAWLTPAQYAARFGMSDADIATTESWLKAQGFVVLGATNGRTAIHFSGTVGQVESAFHTEMHQYLLEGTTHLANSTELALPASLAGVVAGIRGVAEFRPHPMHTAVRRPSADTLKPQYTSTDGSHYLTPNDISTIYNIDALYGAGFDGTGQSIAIVGQSAITTTDIDAFRTAAGLPAKDPTLVLVPNSGVSTIYSGDEDESDIDLEWAGAIAKNASISFVYVGSDSDVGVFDAMEYAIDNNTAPIVSISYGECEVEATDTQTVEPFLMQANAQGQTVLASAGDAGSTGCDDGASATLGLSVSYPASSAYVTAMGGTQFNEGSGTYWNTKNGTGGSSAVSYIPETSWNETAASIAADPSTGTLTSTGGGASILFGKPSWQVATNVPNDQARDVPDISLDAAVYHDGFLYCSEGSCVNSTFASSGATLTAAGGTSFDAPIFAGIMALIHQKNASSNSGNINPQLYSLASTSSSAFHDITTGNNEQPCTSGTTDCPAGTTQIGYVAGVGYDQVTGLGSINAYNLAQVFPASNTITSGALIETATTVAASTPTPVTGMAVVFTAAVTAASGTTDVAGTVNFIVDGGAPVPETLSGGAASYSYTPTTTGTHTVVVNYAGSSTYAASSTSLQVTVASSTSTGSFTIAATNVSVTPGSSVNSSVTLKATNGYSGTVEFNVSVSPSTFNGCFFATPFGVGTNGTVTTSLTVDTLASDCTNSGARHMLTKRAVLSAALPGAPVQPRSDHRLPFAFGAVIGGLALLGRKRKVVWAAMMVCMLGGLGMLSGCGGSSGTPIVTGSTATTYTVTLTATDATYASQTASTTFTVTEQ